MKPSEIKFYLSGATSDGGAQADPDAALGNYRSSTLVVGGRELTAPVNITGLSISDISETHNFRPVSGSLSSVGNVVTRAGLRTPVGAATWRPAGGGSPSNAVLIAHMDGADASTTFTDASSSAHSLLSPGGAEIDTAESVFGGASLILDGTGNVYAADSPDWHFGTNDLTVHFWMKQTDTTNNQIIVCQQTESGNQRSWTFNRLITSGFIQFSGRVTGFTTFVTLTGTTVVTDGVWHHIAVVRSGTSFFLFIDGTIEDTDTQSDAFFDSTAPFGIGAQNISPPAGAGANNYIGWLDEIVIYNGEALWTANFTPPTSASGLIQTLEFTANGETVRSSDVIASTIDRIAPSSEFNSYLLINSATGTSVGSPLSITVSEAIGVLTFVSAGQTLSYAAPGDTAGTAIAVGAGGSFTLYSNDESLSITVTISAGSLPGSDQVDNITITPSFAGNNLFDPISTGEASAGDVEYRCAYIKNESSDILSDFGVFLEHESPSPNDNISIALERPSNDTVGFVQTTANESTAPTGLAFSSPDSDNPILLEQVDLAPGEIVAVWLQWTIDAGATIVENNATSIGLKYTAPLSN